MLRSIGIRAACVLWAALVAAPALAEGDVQVALVAQRVTAQPGKGEILGPADQAKPGDVIEYRATYRNEGQGAVRQLEATLPVPPGTEYLPRTAKPAAVTASLDGKTFESLPLKRTVRLPDGREVQREVPVSEYRWLRWTIGSLAARSAETVRARVRVTPVAAAAAATTR
jgi:uncharacterized repeat protein (TIGR01451 family)